MTACKTYIYFFITGFFFWGLSINKYKCWASITSITIKAWIKLSKHVFMIIKLQNNDAVYSKRKLFFIFFYLNSYWASFDIQSIEWGGNNYYVIFSIISHLDISLPNIKVIFVGGFNQKSIFFCYRWTHQRLIMIVKWSHPCKNLYRQFNLWDIYYKYCLIYKTSFKY